MEVSQIINYVNQGKNVQAQDLIKDLLYSKAGEILSQYKQNLGQALFNQEEE